MSKENNVCVAFSVIVFTLIVIWLAVRKSARSFTINDDRIWMMGIWESISDNVRIAIYDGGINPAVSKLHNVQDSIQLQGPEYDVNIGRFDSNLFYAIDSESGKRIYTFVKNKDGTITYKDSTQEITLARSRV